uniref:Uncharacterized protein n=1 Tax=Salix viminalis TaxID=40686 RepID=A0A6N2KFZ6_SALVM
MSCKIEAELRHRLNAFFCNVYAKLSNPRLDCLAGLFMMSLQTERLINWHVTKCFACISMKVEVAILNSTFINI